MERKSIEPALLHQRAGSVETVALALFRASAAALLYLSPVRLRALVLFALASVGPLLGGSAARAQETSPRAKLAVIVSGDPDDEVRSAALALDEGLAARTGLFVPSDALLRGALRGEPPVEDDGLASVRGLRRSLGLDPDRDSATLVRLGEVTGADALVVVRRGPSGLELSVFDRPAAEWYEGSRHVAGPLSEADLAYVERRARRAARRALEADSASVETSEATSSATSPPARAPRSKSAPPAPLAPTPSIERDEPTSKPSFLKRSWPYLVAGALLAGTVTFFVVRGRPDDPPPPVLRWSQGGNP